MPKLHEIALTATTGLAILAGSAACSVLSHDAPEKEITVTAYCPDGTAMQIAHTGILDPALGIDGYIGDSRYTGDNQTYMNFGALFGCVEPNSMTTVPADGYVVTIDEESHPAGRTDGDPTATVTIVQPATHDTVVDPAKLDGPVFVNVGDLAKLILQTPLVTADQMPYMRDSVSGPVVINPDLVSR